MRNLTVFILILIIYSCCSSRYVSNETIKLNEDIKNIIDDYIIKNPQFDEFILKSTNGMENNSNFLNVNGLLLGPAYEEILDEYPSTLYFDVSGKKVFYLSEINNFLRRERKNWNIKNELDSIVLDYGVIKDPWVCFIYKATYIYKQKSVIEVNHQPDTIFIPKLLDSTIKFENLQ